MTIREVVLPAERKQVEDFLESVQLRYEQNIDQTLYIQEDERIIGTVSAAGHIIKCLAVDSEFRNENIAVMLVSEMIKRLHQQGIYNYQVFTKPEYCAVFENLGFRILVSTPSFVSLEGGDGTIEKAIRKMQVQIQFTLGVDVTAGADVRGGVINGKSFTNGLPALVPYASCHSDVCHVFGLASAR